MTIPPDFPWRAGARYRLSPTHPWCRYEGDDASDDDGNPATETLPTQRSPLVEIDPTDGATVGALAQAVREAWADPTIYVEIGFVGPDAPASAWLRSGTGRDEPYAKESTEFAAWLAAWNARPKEQG